MKKVNIPNLKQKLEHIGMKTTLFDDMEHDNYKNLVCQSVYEIETKQAIAACENFGYNYAIISSDDFVIPISEKHDFI